MQHPRFLDGEYDTNFIPAYYQPSLLEIPGRDELEAAAVVAALLESGALKRSENGPDISENGDGSRTWKMQRVQNMRQ